MPPDSGRPNPPACVLTRRQLAAGAVFLVAGRVLERVVRHHRRPATPLVPGGSLAPRPTDDGHWLTVRTNGVPDHATGLFPGRHCPFPVRPRVRTLTFAREPRPAAAPVPIDGWLFGAARNGVVFDPTGPYWRGREETGWQFEVLGPRVRGFLGIDPHHAHVQPSGEYHYHGLPTGLLVADLEASRARGERPGMSWLGFAADGYPIYGPWGHEDPGDPQSPLVQLRSSYRLRGGLRAGGPGGIGDGSFVQDYEFVPGWGDLDACNGRYGVTPLYPEGTYHYVITYEFPFVPRFWRGEPHPSFAHGKPGAGAVPPALLHFQDWR